MGDKTKLAVSPAIQVGGSLFTPEQLVKIGSLVGADVKIEMTPFKQLYVEIPLDKREDVHDELLRAGLEVHPAGFATKSLIACNFCKGAEEAGLETARKINRAIAGIETPTPLKIGYAGCALGTSEPLLKDIGVVKMRDTFDVYVGGEPKGIKASLGRMLLSGVAEERLVPVLSTIIDIYKKQAKEREKFSKFVDRVTIEQLKQLVV
ncbi:nitrite reductase [Paenibacillus sp. GCM10027627]|uniref:nitrite reductase n=1 Tax=unclassified Paenibacillus TaxID=185978 RepID=UPI0036269B3A